MEFETGKKYHGKFQLWKQKAKFDGTVEYNAAKEIRFSLILSVRSLILESGTKNFKLDTTFMFGTLDDGTVVNFYDLDMLSSKQEPGQNEVEFVFIVHNMVIGRKLLWDTEFNSLICIYNIEQTWEKFQEGIKKRVGEKLIPSRPDQLKVRLNGNEATLSPLSAESSRMTFKVEISSTNCATVYKLQDIRRSMLRFLFPVITNHMTLECQKVTHLVREYELFSTGY